MMERDLIVDFIEWLAEKKSIHLTEEGDWPESYNGDKSFSALLDCLIEEYSHDTDV